MSQMIEPHPPSPQEDPPKPKPLPLPQQQSKRRIIIQLHPLSFPLHPPPQFVAAKSLINSSIPPICSAGFICLQCYHMQGGLDSLLFLRNFERKIVLTKSIDGCRNEGIMERKHMLRKIIALLVTLTMAISITGCSTFFWPDSINVKEYETSSEASKKKEKVVKLDWDEALELADEYLGKMSVEEKVGQIFMLNLEQLDKRKGNYYEFHKCTKTMQKNIAKYHVGGVILFSRNVHSRKQLTAMTSGLQEADRTTLFIAVDEEGGRVARIASNKKMKTTAFPSAEKIGKSKDDKYTYNMGKTIGSEIKELGFNVDFAPVADVKTSELNEEIGDRSFGSDPDKVSEHVSAFIQGLDKVGISGAVKHFPGQGSSEGDTHVGSVDIDSSITRLRKTDFVPFEAGIAAGADFAMVSHISVSKVTESAEPASMSELIMQTILREELGFQKIIITDAFDMASITGHYTSAEAALSAFQGGADIILMPQNFEEAYQAILSGVTDGTIGMERLDASVLRILAVKIQRGFITREQVDSAEKLTKSAEPAETPKPSMAPAGKTKKKSAKTKKRNK